MAVATFVTLSAENHPGLRDQVGSLGRVARLMAERGVNVEAFTADQGGIRMLVSDTKRAASGLRSAGFDPEVHECFEVRVENRPGELAELGERLSGSQVRILESFGVANATGVRLFVRVDQPERAAKLLASRRTP